VQLFVADRAIPESSQLSSPARCAAVNRTGASIGVEPTAAPGGCRGSPPDEPVARRPITTLDNSAVAGLATGPAGAGVCTAGGGVAVETTASCGMVGVATDDVASAAGVEGAVVASAVGAVTGASDAASGAGSVIGSTGGGVGSGVDPVGGVAPGVDPLGGGGSGVDPVGGVASDVDPLDVVDSVDPLGGVSSDAEPLSVLDSVTASVEDPLGITDPGAGSGVNPTGVPDSGAASAALALAAPASVATRAKITIPAHTRPLATILVEGLWVIRSTLPRCLRLPWRPMIDPGSCPCSRPNKLLDTLLAPSRRTQADSAQFELLDSHGRHCAVTRPLGCPPRGAIAADMRIELDRARDASTHSHDDCGSFTGRRLAGAAEGGGTTGPMSPSGASSKSTITGA
jgi:hypothetical protein